MKRMVKRLFAALMIVSMTSAMQWPQSFTVHAETQAAASEPKLEALEQRMKEQGALKQGESLDSYEGKIPVIIALGDGSDEGDFSKDILSQLGGAVEKQKHFAMRAEARLGHEFCYEGVTYVLGNTLATELTAAELEALAPMSEILRISPNFAAIDVGSLEGEEAWQSRPGRRIRRRRALDVHERAAFQPDELSGRGTVIAVIDTGFSVSHPDFDMKDTEGAKYPDAKSMEERIAQINSTAGTELLKGKWFSNKYAYGYNYANNSREINEDGNSHGTHVAGIAASVVRSDAKQAQLIAMRVLAGESDYSEPAKYARAIEDSLLLGADVINLSFGVPAATLKSVGSELLRAIAAAKKMGVTINASAGNESLTDADFMPPTADQPNYGTISAPALAGDVIAVASIDSETVSLPYLEVEGERIAYYPTTDEAATSAYGLELPLYTEAGKAKIEELAALPEGALRGKAVLIERGERRFDEKVASVANLGARLAIIYDDQESGDWINMGIHDPAIPAVFIRKRDGLLLKGMDGKKIVLHREIAGFKIDSAGDLSYFSSWGPTPEFDLKPEIAAVGGHVWAAQPGGGFADKSGTSMAAPQVSSLAALLAERIRKDGDLKLPEAGGTDKNTQYMFMKNMLMSNAVPHRDGEGHYTSPRKQGAGVMNKRNTLRSYAYITAKQPDRLNAEPTAKINLGAIDTDFSLKFTLHNASKSRELRFQLSELTVQTDQLDGKNPKLIKPAGVQEILSPKSGNEVYIVPAMGSVEVSVPVSFASEDERLKKCFRNGYFVEGFVRLRSLTEGQNDIGVPYIAFRHPENKAFTDTPVLESAIYNYAQPVGAAGEAPKYFHAQNSDARNAFTCLTSEADHEEIVLGEKLSEDAGAKRSFDGKRIAISPNGDGRNDYVQFRGVFIAPYYHDRITVKDAQGETVYSGEENYSGEADSNGNIAVGRKNYAAAQNASAGMLYSESEKYRWNGTKGEETAEEGIYRYIFEVMPVAENAALQSYAYDVIVDNTRPAVSDVQIDAGKKQLALKVTENGSGVAEISLKKVDGSGNVTEIKRIVPPADGRLVLSTEESAGVNLCIRDYAGNEYLQELATLMAEGQTGSLKIKVMEKNEETGNTLEIDPEKLSADDYSVTVTDARDGHIVLNPEQLCYGSYTAKLKLRTLLFKGEELEQSFEISAEHPEAELTFLLVPQKPLEVRDIMLQVSTADGKLPSGFRPEVVLTDENGTEVPAKASMSFGGTKQLASLSGLPYGSVKLSRGRWTLRLRNAAGGWKLIPERPVIEIEAQTQYGREVGVVRDLGSKEHPILLAGPETGAMYPKSVLHTEELTLDQISYEAVFDAEAEEGAEKKHSWDGMKFTDFSILPAAVYQLRPVLPEGYYSVPESKRVDLRDASGETVTPDFHIYKKGAEDFGSIHVTTMAEGAENFVTDYIFVNLQGETYESGEKLSYGKWRVRPKYDSAEYIPERPEIVVHLGPDNRTADIRFGWKKLESSEKSGSIRIRLNWGDDYGAKYAFGPYGQKPYVFRLKALDHESEELLFELPDPYFDPLVLSGIPYGRYQLTADLSGKEGYFVDRPVQIIQIDRKTQTIELRYGKTAFPQAVERELQNEDGDVSIRIPASSRLAGQEVKLIAEKVEEVPEKLRKAMASLPEGEAVLYEIHLENEKHEQVLIPRGERLELSLQLNQEQQEQAERLAFFYLSGQANRAGRLAGEMDQTKRCFCTTVDHFSYYALLTEREKPKSYEIRLEETDGVTLSTIPADEAAEGTEIQVFAEITDSRKELQELLLDGSKLEGMRFIMPAHAVVLRAVLKDKEVSGDKLDGEDDGSKASSSNATPSDAKQEELPNTGGKTNTGKQPDAVPKDKQDIQSGNKEDIETRRSSGGSGIHSAFRRAALMWTVSRWTKDRQGWKLRKNDESNVCAEWRKVQGYWYCFDKAGHMCTGWQYSEERWYYLEQNGRMKTNWSFINGKWYYFNPDGTMATGWIKDGDQWYYLSESGDMLQDTWTPDGYRVGAFGAWMN